MWLEGDFDPSNLKIFLEAKDWKNATEEIIRVFDHVKADELENMINCRDLLLIDRLWTKYSNGHFGWSKQMQIWDELNHNFLAFAIRVGWRINGKWVEWFDQAQYDITAPDGHLPLIFSHHGNCQEIFPDWWNALIKIFRECQELQQGCNGRQVHELQTLLKEKKCYGGLIDGDFGSRTSSAVKLLQGTQNLPRTGIADLATWTKLLEDQLI